MTEQFVQDTERVAIDVSDHVATVTLTRPEKHNALDVAMFDAITAAAARVAVEPGVRAVVLHGEGPSFCSGLDVAGVMANQPGSDALMDPLHGPVPNWFQRAAHGWLEVPVPVIAAIHGHCLGGGLQIALAADVRFATPDARMAVLEVKWGLIPDMAITRTLPRLVGIDVAKELAYTGRMISGSEAHDARSRDSRCRGPAGCRPGAGGGDRDPLTRRRAGDEAAVRRVVDRLDRGDAAARGRHPARADRDAQPARRGDARAWPSSRREFVDPYRLRRTLAVSAARPRVEPCWIRRNIGNGSRQPARV